MAVYPCSKFAHNIIMDNMGKASHKTPTSRDGGVERAQWNNKAHATWLIKTPPSDKDVILSVMTRLSYATHDSQCTKQNMSLIINVDLHVFKKHCVS